MTRAEIRIAAAQKRVVEAERKLTMAYEKSRAAIEVTVTKHEPRIKSASDAVRDARVKLADAKLAALGIEPMKTIVMLHGGRFTTRIMRSGYIRMAPVGVRGRILRNRDELSAPHRWDDVVVTQDVVT